MMMTVMRVTISRRDTADTTITDEILSLHVSLFSITDVGNSCVPQLPEIYISYDHYYSFVTCNRSGEYYGRILSQ